MIYYYYIVHGDRLHILLLYKNAILAGSPRRRRTIDQRVHKIGHTAASHNANDDYKNRAKRARNDWFRQTRLCAGICYTVQLCMYIIIVCVVYA